MKETIIGIKQAYRHIALHTKLELDYIADVLDSDHTYDLVQGIVISLVVFGPWLLAVLWVLMKLMWLLA